jgi:cell division septation protein DedD
MTAPQSVPAFPPARARPGRPARRESAGGAPAPWRATRLVERDVEAPEVFQVTEPGLWDGRPSLGGVWVAHPDVQDPERVIIRNAANGNFVIGALFRKERATPGPRLQVSSDAAAALGLVAGQPQTLNVTALRREAAPDAADAPADARAEAAPMAEAPAGADMPAAAATTPSTAPATTPGAIATAALDAADATAALDAADATASADPAPAPAAPPRAASTLERPFIQIGIFSIEQNAINTAASMRTVGLVPTIKPGTSSGKQFWRVVVGPATSASERAQLLRTIRAQGFEDAYAVTN